MKQFMFIYRADFSNREEFEKGMTPEAIAEMNKAWMAWGQKVGSAIVEFGSPTMPTEFSADKTVGGYSIVQADDVNAAQLLTVGHPHLEMGGSIDIYEILPTPGA